MPNLTPLTPALAVRSWLTLEVTREGGLIQAIATTPSRSPLSVGDTVELGLPFCKRLLVQSVNRERVTLGCWLAIYLNARPKDPEKRLPRSLGDALKGMLVARGVPLASIDINNTQQTGAIPRVGNDPVEVADALGYVLYCDADLKVRLAPKLPLRETLGQFDMDELASYQPGEEGPLSANRIVVKGELVAVKLTQGGGESTFKERVATGWRTTTSRSVVVGKVQVDTETVFEPPSEISRFSATYEKTTDPNALIFRFSSPIEESAMKSQSSVTVTTRDREGHIVKRERKITGCAAKGLSSFYSAWAGASIPKPDPSTIEPPAPDTGLTGGNKDYTIYGVGGDSNSAGNSTPSAFTGSTAAPVTLLKPSGMFEVVPLLHEVEKWDYKKDRVKYTRDQLIPLGAIIPEMGSPIFGYQDPTEKSPPIYRDPLPLNLAEREVVTWAKDRLGRWESRRTLSQAIGVRNAQEPRDAMEAVQFTEGSLQASTTNRAVVAINVAAQLKIAASSLQYSEPPGASPLEDMQEVETFTPFEELIELSGDLLDRTLEITPSPFCPSLEGVRKVAEYAALELRGQANTVRIGLPLSTLPYDLPPNSLIELEGKKYLTVRVAASVSSSEAVLNLDLWEA